MYGTRPRHWLIALLLAAAALALGWLVVTHITNVATDQATKAVEQHQDGQP